MNENQQKPTLIEERQKTAGLWAAGIFAFLGLAFLIFSLYNILLLQKGKADFSDTILTPVTILMVLARFGWFLPDPTQPPDPWNLVGVPCCAHSTCHGCPIARKYL